MVETGRQKSKMKYINPQTLVRVDQFENETGIDLNLEIPEQLKRKLSLIGLSFKIF